MTVRASIITFAVVSVLGLAGLLLAASADERSTAFSLDVPPANPVATLQPGHPICQGPIDPTAAFGSATVWIEPNSLSGPPLKMDIRSEAGRTVATGSIPGGYEIPISPSFALSTPVPASRAIRVCLTDGGTRPAIVLGTDAGNVLSESHSGDLQPASGPGHLAMALLFERPHPKSLLSLLPTVFSRAALFKPGRVGAWTFWVLSAAMLGAFGLGALAVAKAVRTEA